MMDMNKFITKNGTYIVLILYIFCANDGHE